MFVEGGGEEMYQVFLKKIITKIIILVETEWSAR